jgi:acyl-CoA dehydrogenase
MRLALSQDQLMLAKTAAAFAANRSPLSRAHKLRHDSSSSLDYSPVVWKEMAALGWTGIPFGEKEGGAGLGLAEVVIVTEALGRCLAPEPFVPSVILAGQALALAGSESQRSRWLPRIISADGVLALAYQEAGARYDTCSVATAARKTQDGYRLSGAKIQIAGGFGAEAFIVTARTSGSRSDDHGITMFLVPAGTPGIEIVRQHRVDSRNAAMLKLTDAQVPDTAIVGQLDGGREVLEDVIDRATVALCGEMLGAMAEALDRTLAYLKERVQFGVVIGTFQALKHRVARLFIEVELARSAVLAAARAIDEGSEHRAALTSNAKARCSDAYRLIANEAIQLHGGIGTTDEHEIGMFIKHAAVAAVTFGDARYHRERFANRCGY